MAHKNPDKFFNDPSAINPQTGQLLHPPAPPPDPKILQLQAKAQVDQAAAAHQLQIAQQKTQSDTIHQQVKAHAAIELARIKAELDAKMAVLDAHLKVATEARKQPRSYPPGARKARDCHHYVSDPHRTGKYLLVVHHA
jgi:hypothetical protein